MLRLRTARGDDVQLLRELLFQAAFWRSNLARPPLDEALANPELARYVEGFGRPGAPGYGFLDEVTPEVSAAVLPGHRGRGIGTALLESLESEARERGIARLSLSVERDNRAVALYQRLGFRPLAGEGNALTMVIELSRPLPRRSF